jgi:hypothetical protein
MLLSIKTYIYAVLWLLMYFILFILFADYGALIIIALCLYILFFASGLGATPWAINSEVLLFYYKLYTV